MYSELPVDCLKSPMSVHVTETHVAPIVKTKVSLLHHLLSILVVLCTCHASHHCDAKKTASFYFCNNYFLIFSYIVIIIGTYILNCFSADVDKSRHKEPGAEVD